MQWGGLLPERGRAHLPPETPGDTPIGADRADAISCTGKFSGAVGTSGACTTMGSMGVVYEVSKASRRDARMAQCFESVSAATWHFAVLQNDILR